MADVGVLEAEWLAALDDAGLTADSFVLYPLDGAQAQNHAGAFWFAPWRCASTCEIPDPDRRAEVNDPANRHLHRIAIWCDVEPAVLGARLRHELEHARQWKHYGASIFGLYDLVNRVLERKAGGLDGCGGWYVNAIPAEQDANAAAAMFLRRRHGKAVERLCRDNDHRMFACSLVGPEALDTLPVRMVAFAFLYRDRCREVADASSCSFECLLDAAFQGISEYWRCLSATHGGAGSPPSQEP